MVLLMLRNLLGLRETIVFSTWSYLIECPLELITYRNRAGFSILSWIVIWARRRRRITHWRGWKGLRLTRCRVVEWFAQSRLPFCHTLLS